jgi:hypothetical protein
MNSMEISTYKDFMDIADRAVKRQVLVDELADKSAKELSDIWGCQVYNIYDRMRQLSIPSQRNTGEVKNRAPRKPAGATAPTPKVDKEIKKMAANDANSFTIKLVLSAKGEEISDRLMRLIDILNKDATYNLTFDIKEIRRSEPDGTDEAEEAN